MDTDSHKTRSRVDLDAKPSNYASSIHSTFRHGLRLLAFGTTICLVILSIVGFQNLGKRSPAVSSLEDLQATTSDGCLLFLIAGFGVLLFLGEFKWEAFFFFFGFLRYRLGRSILYAISGNVNHTHAYKAYFR
jgi:hypothetical protein